MAPAYLFTSSGSASRGRAMATRSALPLSITSLASSIVAILSTATMGTSTASRTIWAFSTLKQSGTSIGAQR